SDQPPETCPVASRSLIFPSLPTTRQTRLRSSVVEERSSATSLNASARRPAVPVHVTGRGTEKAPFLSAVSTSRICSASKWVLAGGVGATSGTRLRLPPGLAASDLFPFFCPFFGGACGAGREAGSGAGVNIEMEEDFFISSTVKTTAGKNV